MNYKISKIFESKVERTPRVLEIAESFGLGLSDKEFVIYRDLELPVEQGNLVYITGQSGSGKSLLLRDLKAAMIKEGKTVIDIDEITFDDSPLIDQIGKTTTDALRLLSLAGLNDAYLFIRKPSELSDGQKYRFRMAKVIELMPDVIIADEFTATLDRVTAKVVAFNLHKITHAKGANITVIVATTHADLKEDLKPDLYIEKYYRERLKIEVNNGI